MPAIRLTKTPSGSATKSSGWHSSDVSQPRVRVFGSLRTRCSHRLRTVIALAQPSEPVNRIRTMIRQRLRLLPETRNEADLWCIPRCFAIAVRYPRSGEAPSDARRHELRRHSRGRGDSRHKGAGVSVLFIISFRAAAVSGAFGAFINVVAPNTFLDLA